jgi:hypothetical protein
MTVIDKIWWTIKKKVYKLNEEVKYLRYDQIPGNKAKYKSIQFPGDTQSF